MSQHQVPDVYWWIIQSKCPVRGCFPLSSTLCTKNIQCVVNVFIHDRTHTSTSHHPSYVTSASFCADPLCILSIFFSGVTYLNVCLCCVYLSPLVFLWIFCPLVPDSASICWSMHRASQNHLSLASQTGAATLIFSFMIPSIPVTPNEKLILFNLSYIQLSFLSFSWMVVQPSTSKRSR